MFEDDLQDFSESDASALRQVIDRVAHVAPEATAGRSYGLPAFLYRGKPLLGFAARRNHLSLYPFSPDALDAVKDELDGFELSKGTVRFTAEHPLPAAAVEKMVRARMAEIAAP